VEHLNDSVALFSSTKELCKQRRAISSSCATMK